MFRIRKKKSTYHEYEQDNVEVGLKLRKNEINSNTRTIKGDIPSFLSTECITEEQLKEKLEADIRAVQEQKKKDALVKAGLQVIYQQKKVSSKVPARIRHDEYNIIDKTIDERVAYCRYLQDEIGEDLFNKQYTTIHKAAMDGDFLGVKYFLDRSITGKYMRANVDDYDNKGICPIHYAAMHNRVEIIELLILCGCDVNVLTADGMSSVMLASKYGSQETLKKLFYLGGDLLLKSKNNVTAAHYAAQNDHGSILLLLVDLFRDYKSVITLVAIETATEEDLESVRAHHSNNNSNSKISSSSNNNSSSNVININSATNRGVSNTNTIVNTNLNLTVEDMARIQGLVVYVKNQYMMGKVVLNDIINMNDDTVINISTMNGVRPIHLAAENDCVKAIDALISCMSGGSRGDGGVAVSIENNRIYCHHTDIDINAIDNSGETALHKAGRNKNYEIYKKLVSMGANEIIENVMKQSPKQLLIDEINL